MKAVQAYLSVTTSRDPAGFAAPLNDAPGDSAIPEGRPMLPSDCGGMCSSNRNSPLRSKAATRPLPESPTTICRAASILIPSGYDSDWPVYVVGTSFVVMSLLNAPERATPLPIGCASCATLPSNR